MSKLKGVFTPLSTWETVNLRNATLPDTEIYEVRVTPHDRILGMCHMYYNHKNHKIRFPGHKPGYTTDERKVFLQYLNNEVKRRRENGERRKV